MYMLSLSYIDENDFTFNTQDIVFNQNTLNGRECFSFSIVDDDILEENETFRVILQPDNDLNITFLESTVLVTIIDDDSKSSNGMRPFD